MESSATVDIDRCECWRANIRNARTHARTLTRYIPPRPQLHLQRHPSLLCSTSGAATQPYSNPAAAGSLNYATTPVECCSDVRTNFLHYFLFWFTTSPSACLSVRDCKRARLGRVRPCSREFVGVFVTQGRASVVRAQTAVSLPRSAL